jgi:hypothetical protein
MRRSEENANVNNVARATCESGIKTPENGANVSPETGAKAYTKTQILSDVMKNAWRFFKMTGARFSECLQRAWRNYRLVKFMLLGIVKFYYQKVDGTMREAYGTLSGKFIPKTAGENNRKKNDFVRVYFDTEKQEWRSFKKFNLVSIA